MDLTTEQWEKIVARLTKLYGDDVAQETCIMILKRKSSEPKNLMAWAKQVARSMSKREYRRVCQAKEIPFDEQAEGISRPWVRLGHRRYGPLAAGEARPLYENDL